MSLTIAANLTNTISSMWPVPVCGDGERNSVRVLSPISEYFRHRHQLLFRHRHRCPVAGDFLAVSGIHAVACVPVVTGVYTDTIVFPLLIESLLLLACILSLEFPLLIESLLLLAFLPILLVLVFSIISMKDCRQTIQSAVVIDIVTLFH